MVIKAQKKNLSISSLVLCIHTFSLLHILQISFGKMYKIQLMLPSTITPEIN